MKNTRVSIFTRWHFVVCLSLLTLSSFLSVSRANLLPECVKTGFSPARSQQGFRAPLRFPITISFWIFTFFYTLYTSSLFQHVKTSLLTAIFFIVLTTLDRSCRHDVSLLVFQTIDEAPVKVFTFTQLHRKFTPQRNSPSMS